MAKTSEKHEPAGEQTWRLSDDTFFQVHETGEAEIVHRWTPESTTTIVLSRAEVRALYQHMKGLYRD